MGIPVASIANLDALLDYLTARPELAQWRHKVDDYRKRYGVVSHAHPHGETG